MCVPLIVFLPAANNMLNHFRATAPAAADQIACAERLEQGFGLIEPGGIRGSVQNVKAWLAVLKELRRLIAGMAGTVIHNQVNAMSPTIRMKEALYGRTKMFTIILIQALRKHMPRMQGQTRQQMDGSVPLIVKLHSFDLTRSHRLLRIYPFQDLQVGLLIGCEHGFLALPQALDSLVIPQDFEDPRNGFLVPDSSLPKPNKWQSQLGSIQISRMVV